VSVARSLTQFRAFAHVGTTEAMAYRAEAFVWLLSGTMPLIMIAFFGAVTRDGPIGRYSTTSVVAYFLATFVVRNLTASRISWQVNLEIRDGTLGGRLLLPVHPLVAYAAESLGAMPVRVLGSATMALVMLAVLASGSLSHDPFIWLLWSVSVVLAWLLSLFVSVTIGALAFFVDSSAKLMDAWLAGLFVFSGYLIPVDLFPPRLRAVVDWLPFRYQLGLPAELMVGAHDELHALLLVGRQLGFVVAGAVITLLVWRRGLARFAAHGG
jgi:ABC-2 type transport system permease protein